MPKPKPAKPKPPPATACQVIITPPGCYCHDCARGLTGPTAVEAKRGREAARVICHACRVELLGGASGG